MANDSVEQLNVSTEQLNKNGDRRGMSPNSRKNLEKRKSWKKGESGNPQGQSITARQKELMSEACPFDGQARPWLEALAEGGMRQALTTPVALSNLQDRHEGKVTIPIGGDKEKPVQVEYMALLRRLRGYGNKE